MTRINIRPKGRRVPRAVREQAEQLLAAGIERKEVALRTGVSVTTICLWAWELHAPLQCGPEGARERGQQLLREGWTAAAVSREVRVSPAIVVIWRRALGLEP